MKLKYIVPDMAQTFGNLEFAGENEVEQSACQWSLCSRDEKL